MPKEIWSEGRVTGLSSYEIYVKQHLSVDPNTPPATERQWLASNLGMGTSLLLKVPEITVADEDAHSFIDIEFPENCMLTAANTIIAGYFEGDAEFGDGDWATKVTSYGPLIENDDEASPEGVVGPEGTIPCKDLTSWSDEEIERLKEYLRIVDAVVIQPGTWTDSPSGEPKKDFTPDLAGNPRIRLHIKGSITHSPYILLTGLSIRYILSGVSGLDGSTETPNPQDGDFLGPAIYPWANKVIFTVPSTYIAYFASTNYARKIPASASTAQTVTDQPIIDMVTTNPGTYYEGSDAKIPYDVTGYTTLSDNAAVLTVYQKNSIYPPALYGTLVSESGANYLNPLDVVAPGTVKLFQNATASQLLAYETEFPGTFAVNRTNDGVLQTLDTNGNMISPVVTMSIQDLSYTNRTSSHVKAKGVVHNGVNQKDLTLSLSNTLGTTAVPTQYTMSAAPTNTITPDSNGNINWGMLLEALANNLGVDVLESNLKTFKSNLPNVKSGTNGVLQITGTGASSVAGSLGVSGALSTSSTITSSGAATVGGALTVNGTGTSTIKGPVTIQNNSITVGKNYITFSNGLRLYISSSQPTDTDVPVGSIGIGWGFTN